MIHLSAECCAFQLSVGVRRLKTDTDQKASGSNNFISKVETFPFLFE